MLKVADLPARGSENANEAEAIAGDVIVARGVLLGVGNEEHAADVLDVEGAKPGEGPHFRKHPRRGERA